MLLRRITAGVMGFGRATGMAAAFLTDPPENSQTRNPSDVAGVAIKAVCILFVVISPVF